MRESEYIANRQLAQSIEPLKPLPVRRVGFLTALLWILGELADRLAPLLALCFFMLSIGLLGNAADVHSRFIAGCALVISCVAMWAFWGGSEMTARKPKLFHPGAPELLHPNMRAKLKQKKEAPAEEWRAHWTPLEPSPPRQVRAGSMDFMKCPSVIGGRN